MAGDTAVNWKSVATFGNSVEAGIAAGALQDHGFDVHVANAELSDMAWYLTNAMGGVKVMVPDHQVQEASAVIEQLRIETSDSDEEGNDGELEDEGETLGRPAMDVEVDRGFRAAMLGLLFFPLNFYSVYLLLRICWKFDAWSSANRWKWRSAMLMNTLILGLFAMILLSPLWEPDFASEVERLPEKVNIKIPAM